MSLITRENQFEGVNPLLHSLYQEPSIGTDHSTFHSTFAYNIAKQLNTEAGLENGYFAVNFPLDFLSQTITVSTYFSPEKMGLANTKSAVRSSDADSSKPFFSSAYKSSTENTVLPSELSKKYRLTTLNLKN